MSGFSLLPYLQQQRGPFEAVLAGKLQAQKQRNETIKWLANYQLQLQRQAMARSAEGRAQQMHDERLRQLRGYRSGGGAGGYNTRGISGAQAGPANPYAYALATRPGDIIARGDQFAVQGNIPAPSVDRFNTLGGFGAAGVPVGFANGLMPGQSPTPAGARPQAVLTPEASAMAVQRLAAMDNTPDAYLSPQATGTPASASQRYFRDQAAANREAFHSRVGNTMNHMMPSTFDDPYMQAGGDFTAIDPDQRSLPRRAYDYMSGIPAPFSTERGRRPSISADYTYSGGVRSSALDAGIVQEVPPLDEEPVRRRRDDDEDNPFAAWDQ